MTEKSTPIIEKDTIWNEKNYKNLLKILAKEQDETYQKFNSKIINTNYKMLGIKTPILRKLAKTISKTNIESFLAIKNPNTYEEILLRGFVLAYITDKETFSKYFEIYIKQIDNWALCDLALSKLNIVKTNQKYFIKKIENYLKQEEFICRCGLVLLLYYYIDDEHIDYILETTKNINREEYYINMALAWLLSICFIKYKEKTLKYLKTYTTNYFVFSMTINKICDSYRVSKEDKIYIKNLKLQRKNEFQSI